MSVVPARLYWTGNAAKARVLGRILADDRPNLSIMDYGAGRGGDWPVVLRERPGLALVCYEPEPNASKALTTALAGLPARVLSDEQFAAERSKADYIVSFSVLEHVYDRSAYFSNAKKFLAEDGEFHLNYDDGHFRTSLDLDERRDLKVNLAETLINRSAGVWHRLGREHLYQARVSKSDATRLAAEAGFRVVEDRYENLRSLKHLAKTIPPERTQEFTRWWIDVEDQLNNRFRAHSEDRMGDDTNLWREMASRTLVLKHA